MRTDSPETFQMVKGARKIPEQMQIGVSVVKQIPKFRNFVIISTCKWLLLQCQQLTTIQTERLKRYLEW